MRKQPVITERDAETGGRQQHAEDREVKPINAEIPQVPRHRRQSEKKRTDQERARRPINSIDWNSKNHGRVVGDGRMPTKRNKSNEIFSTVVSFCIKNNIRIGFVKIARILSTVQRGRPRITSALVQLWILPQCAQVNFCVLTLAALQSFSSIVRPVSVSFDVAGHRTSKLFMFTNGNTAIEFSEIVAFFGARCALK